MNTKFFAILLAVLLFGEDLIAQKYYVMNVIGKVIQVKTNKEVTKGMYIEKTDQLKFGAADAKVLAMNEANGREVLEATKAKKTASGEFVAFVSEVLTPSTANLRLSTRGKREPVKNLKDYFGNETFYFIGEETKIPLDQGSYNLKDDKFFAATYKSGSNVVKKRILHGSSELIIKKSDLFKYQGREYAPESCTKMNIYFYDISDAAGNEVCNVQLLFVDEQTLIEDMEQLIKHLKTNTKLSKEKMAEALFDYFLESYGRTDKAAFEDWLGAKTSYKS